MVEDYLHLLPWGRASSFYGQDDNTKSNFRQKEKPERAFVYIFCTYVTMNLLAYHFSSSYLKI